MHKHTGIIVYEGPSMLDGRPIVAIATLKSGNIKTGDMAQLWILSALTDPLTSLRLGIDASICGDCPHRGDGMGRERACYVDVGKAPMSVWRAFRAGKYVAGDRALEAAEYALSGRQVRLGAYGDPAAIPEPILRRLTGASDGHTGYTHAWRRFPSLKTILMASADSLPEQAAAEAEGWRCFVVLPASHEGKAPAGTIWCRSERVQCRDCLLCDGKRSADRRKSIAIVAHGSGAGRVTAD